MNCFQNGLVALFTRTTNPGSTLTKAKIFIGTSGWNYKHWKGTFYPPEIKDSEEFSIYSQTFDTVEINNSFYRLPTIKTFNAWRKSSPEHFIFSVKASRYITHMKKLNIDHASVKKFFARAGKLKAKLGPVLFQLPPNWKINVERLRSFLTTLSKDYRYTFEFRNHTWYDDSVYEELEKFNCAFCIYELEGHLSPCKETADFIYVRLHGPGNKYQGSYSDAALKKWKRKCVEWQYHGKDVYIYFDNDQEGYAAFNGRTLLKMIRQDQILVSP